jgi:hypothetical protein
MQEESFVHRLFREQMLSFQKCVLAKYSLSLLMIPLLKMIYQIGQENLDMK